MASDWEQVSLGSLVDIKHGFAFKSEFFSETPTNHQLVTPGNFAIGGGFQFGKGKYYSGPVPQEYILKEGQVVVTMTDLSKAGDTLGYAAVIPKTEKIIWLHNQRVGLLIFKNEELLSPAFAHYLMRSPEYRHHVVAGATGSTVKHTAPTRICEYKFQLPTIAEQKNIGQTLSLLDDRITLLRETNKTLEAIARAIFKSWFIDFDPVRAKMEGRTPAGMDEETAALFPDELVESEIGLVPKGWDVKTIGDVVDTLGGATPDTKNSDYWEPAEHYWSSPKDLSGLNDPALLSTERRVSSAGLLKISSGLLPVGTLLMSSRAPIGYLAISDVPLAINQGYIAIPPGGRLSPLYMLRWCQANMEGIKGRANGSTFMEISKKAFRPIPILLPNSKLLDLFEETCGTLFDKLVLNSKQAQTLSELRDSLLPRLISGKLRLADAVAEVG